VTMHTPLSPAAPEIDALLAGYAAGSLSPALHALVGAHLEISPVNRSYVRVMEEALASRLVTQPARPLRSRDARLAEIFGVEPAPKPQVMQGDPRAIIQFFGKPIDELGYKTLLPGVRECRLDAGAHTRAILYRIRAGQKLPEHTHDGSEVTLVLRGSFHDESGHFKRGDIVIADEDVNHIPYADESEECVCFSVIDAPVRLTGPLGRLINPFLSH
jgi:putative transcriptional regulator